MIDLHLHSIFSDGTETPTKLIELVAKTYPGSIIALTDHDTLEGIEEFLQAGIKYNIKTISGIELSVNYFHPIEQIERNVHILGYGLHATKGSFKKFLTHLVEMRSKRCKRMIDKFNALNLRIEISYSDVFNKVTKACGRPHLALVMVEKGIVKSVPEAFDLYLGDNKPCYEPKETINLEDAHNFLRKYCNLTSIAHPIHYWPPGSPEMEEEFHSVLDKGFDGIEVFHYSNAEINTRNWFLNQAQERDLFVTGGSDYHGKKIRNVEIGEFSVPEEYFKIFQDDIFT